MRETKDISFKNSIQFIESHHIFSTLSKQSNTRVENKPLSTFTLDVNTDSNSFQLIIIFDCDHQPPIHLKVSKNIQNEKYKEINNDLFGLKSYDWLHSVINSLNLIKFQIYDQDSDLDVKKKNIILKLKTITILINILSFNLLVMNNQKTHFIFQNIQKVNPVYNGQESNQIFLKYQDLLKNEKPSYKYGIALMVELFKTFNYNLEILTKRNSQIHGHILNELYLIFESQLLYLTLSKLERNSFGRNRKTANSISILSYKQERKECATR